jgi:hypothetical protein
MTKNQINLNKPIDRVACAGLYLHDVPMFKHPYCWTIFHLGLSTCVQNRLVLSHHPCWQSPKSWMGSEVHFHGNPQNQLVPSPTMALYLSSQERHRMSNYQRIPRKVVSIHSPLLAQQPWFVYYKTNQSTCNWGQCFGICVICIPNLANLSWKVTCLWCQWQR